MTLTIQDNFVGINQVPSQPKATFSIGSVGLFINESDTVENQFTTRYKEYISFSALQSDITVNSDAYKSAKIMLKDNVPNLLNAPNGRLVVVKMNPEAEDVLDVLEEIKTDVDFSIFTTSFTLTTAEMTTIVNDIDINNHLFIGSITGQADITTIKADVIDVKNGMDNVPAEFILGMTGNNQDDARILRCAFATKLASNDVFFQAKVPMHKQIIMNFDVNEYSSVFTQTIQDQAIGNGINTYAKYNYGVGGKFYQTTLGIGAEAKLNHINLKKKLQVYLTNYRAINKDNIEFEVLLSDVKRDIFEVLLANNVFKRDLTPQDIQDIDFGVQADKERELLELNKGYYIYIPKAEQIIGKTAPISYAVAFSETILKYTATANLI